MPLKILTEIYNWSDEKHHIMVGLQNKDTYLTAAAKLTLDEIEDLEIELIELTKQLANYRRGNERI